MKGIVIRLSVIFAIAAFAFAAKATDMPWWVDSIGQLYVTGEVDCVELTIPDGVTRILQSSFEGCKSIERVHFPQSLVGIHSCAFDGCTNLKELILPDGVSEIYAAAFRGCKALASVEIPDGLMEIRTEVFKDCTSLKEIVLPTSITNIDGLALANCTSLCRVYVGRDSSFKIADTAFSGCPDFLEFIEFDYSTNELAFVEVSLDPNGGALEESKIRTVFGHNFGLLPEPERDGYVFDGWWTAVDGGNEVTSTTKVQKGYPETLFAHWNPIVVGEFTTGGDAEWSLISDGVWQSGPVDGGQSTWLKMLVMDGGDISFMWTLSYRHPTHYMITFLVDNIQYDTICFETNWVSSVHKITSPGPHMIEWVFEKSPDAAYNEVCGFVKNIVWTPDTGTPELEYADANVAKLIGGDAAKYGKFRAWANGVDGGASAVVTSDWAAVSYMLGAKKLFGNQPQIKIHECSVGDAVAGAGREFSVTLQFLDGEENREVSAESVAELFEMSNDLRGWEGIFTIPQKSEGMGASHSFTVVPGDATATRVFLRVRASVGE